ncbi:hypothetical protein THAOC_05900, partial [Thalassiosira oceanica]
GVAVEELAARPPGGHGGPGGGHGGARGPVAAGDVDAANARLPPRRGRRLRARWGPAWTDRSRANLRRLNPTGDAHSVPEPSFSLQRDGGLEVAVAAVRVERRAFSSPPSPSRGPSRPGSGGEATPPATSSRRSGWSAKTCAKLPRVEKT